MRSNCVVKALTVAVKEAFIGREDCGNLDRAHRKWLMKYFVWSVALYRANSWSLYKRIKKRLEAFEAWIWGKKSDKMA